MFVLAIFSIPLIIIPFVMAIIRFYRFFRDLKIIDLDGILDSTEMEVAVYKKKRKYDYPEILFMGISPLLGIIFIFIFRKDIHPFAPEHTLSLGVLVVIAYASYWLLRTRKETLPLSVHLWLPVGMMIGILLYFVLFLHLLSPMILLGAAVFPFFAFPLFAPIPALLYNIKALHLQRTWLLENEMIDSTVFLGITFKRTPWYRNGVYYLLVIGVIIVLQVSLLPFGQEVDSLIKVFTEGEEFFFSKK